MKTVIQMNVTDFKPPRTVRLVIADKMHHFEERKPNRLGEPGWVDMERDSDAADFIDPYYLQRVLLRVLAVGLVGGEKRFTVVGNTEYRLIDLGDVIWGDHMTNMITRAE